jgi:hypothetical protein
MVGTIKQAGKENQRCECIRKKKSRGAYPAGGQDVK